MTYLYGGPCILIGGAARSGTTLLGEILTSHPKAAVLLEERLTNVVLAVERLSSIRSPSDEGERVALFGGPRSFLPSPLWDDEADIEKLSRVASYAARFRQLFKVIFEVTAEKRDVTVVGSKLPISEGWEDIGLLRSRLSDLRIILVLRNPIDVISSSMVRARNATLGLDEWMIRNVDSACAQWLFAMQCMDDLSASALPGQVLLVKYEELCEFPDREERRIYDFASLESTGQRVIARPRKDSRYILSAQDSEFLHNELGEVDRHWPDLTPRQALERYSKIVRHLPIGEASLENGSYSWALASGFGGIEAWGRWTDGPKATLRFRHPELKPGAKLGLHVAMARTPPGRSGAPLSIRVNAGQPRAAMAKPGERLDIGLSEDDLAQEILTVEISVLEPKPSSEAPINDPRKLGIAITGLSLGP